MRAPGDDQKGSGNVCTCVHTRACIQAHTCTHSHLPGASTWPHAHAHEHTGMHTTHVVPRHGSGGEGISVGPAGWAALSRAQAHRPWRRSCQWWAHRCPRGSRGPRCPGISWSLASVHTAPGPPPGTCGTLSEHRSHPHGRTGTGHAVGTQCGCQELEGTLLIRETPGCLKGRDLETEMEQWRPGGGGRGNRWKQRDKQEMERQ